MVGHKTVEYFDWSQTILTELFIGSFLVKMQWFRSMPVTKGFEDIGKKIVNSPDNQESLTRELEHMCMSRLLPYFYTPRQNSMQCRTG